MSIPLAIVPALEEHLGLWAQPGRSGPLFTGERGGLRRASIYKAWRSALAATGSPVNLHPHDFRHLANTLAARVPSTTTKDLMTRIGHTSPQAALRYLYASPEADRAMSAGVDAAIRAVQQRTEGSPRRFPIAISE